jgi:hypothetical protein
VIDGQSIAAAWCTKPNVHVFVTLLVGFLVAAIPEPSTWAMLLIEFAGSRFMGYGRGYRVGAIFA